MSLRLHFRSTRPLVAIVSLAVSACAQHDAGALPASPSLAAPMSARAAKGAALSTSVKVHFPTPLEFGQDDTYVDNLAPSVAMMTPTTVVEENGEEGTLAYRVGSVADINTIAWGSRVPLGEGSHPSLATDGVSTVVDVHTDASGNLLYRVGTLANGAVKWGGSHAYQTGGRPHAAFSGPGALVEVHDGENGYIYSMVGEVDAVKQTISFGHAVKIDAGHRPSVAADAAGDVIEVHSGSAVEGYSHLYYHVGKIDTKSKSVTWETHSQVPGTVSSPSSVTWSPQGYLAVGDVCEGSRPFNFYYLCTTMGSLGADNTITWFGNSRSYLDYYPTTLSIALNGAWGVAALGFPSPAPGSPAIMELATSLLSDRSNWEGDRLNTTLKGKTLHQIVFPASHDAGMYADVFGGVGAEALAQDEDVYGQLIGGQRYFDFRPDNFLGDLHFYHGKKKAPIEGPLVQDALNDVAKYMKEGHREVVILKFSHFDFSSPTSDWYDKLLSMVETTLGPWLYDNKTGTRLADIRLSDLIGGGTGIVLPVMDVDTSPGKKGIYTYRDWQSKDDPGSGQVTAFDRYSNTEDYPTMKKDQLNKYASFDGKMEYDPKTPCDFFLLSWTLTPIAKVWSVAFVADAHLGHVMDVVNRNRYGQIPNILYVDYYEWADPADVAIQMNERL